MPAFRFRHVPDSLLRAAGVERTPEVDTALSLLDDRDRQLEDWLSRLAPDFRFHFRGALTVSTSDDDLVTASGSSLVVWGRLTTAGTTTTTVVVKLDGTTVVTLTFASGVKNALPATYAVATVAGSGLAAGVTAVGTGAGGLVVGVVPA